MTGAPATLPRTPFWDYVGGRQVPLSHRKPLRYIGNKMPDELPKGRCVHCLRFADDITDDHVFPYSWYPESTPATVQRWTVPCCKRCNKELGAMESDLLVRLALCLDPKSEAARGIPEKALRSLGIDAGELTPKEREHREKRRLKLKAELIPLPAVEQAPGAIPGLVRHSGPAEFALPIPWAGLSIVAEKIARGCEYKLKSKKFVEPPYAVRTCVTEPDVVSPLFLSHRKVIDFGPGCQAIRVFAAEDENVVRYRILIWSTLCFHVLFDQEEYFRTELDPKMKPVEGISPEDRKGMRIPPYLREFE